VKNEKRVTIWEVAKLANVSAGTVSRFLNGIVLKPSTEKRVREAISQTGYQKNITARTLRTGHSKSIGIILPEWKSYYSMSVIEAFESVVFPKGYALIVSSYSDFSEQLSNMLLRNIDGVLCIPPSGIDDVARAVIKECGEKGVPAVIINEYFERCEADFVMIDNAGSSMRAVEYGIHQGHTDIAIINGLQTDYVSRERHHGYREALNLYDLGITDEYEKYGLYSAEGGYAAGIELLSLNKPPTAIFITNCAMAIGFFRAARELKVSIPEDVLVIAYDFDTRYEFISPNIPYVEQPLGEMGLQAAELLLRRIAGDNRKYPQNIQLKTRLIINKNMSDTVSLSSINENHELF